MRVVQDAGLVAAVRAAYKQKNIRLCGKDFRSVILGQLKRVGLYNLCACAKACALGCFRRKLRHEAACDHPKAARSAGTRVALRKIELARLLLKARNCVCKPVVHICLHGGVSGG